MKKILYILLFLLLITACNKEQLENKIPETKMTVSNELFVEVNTEHTISEYVTIENGELLNGDDIIDSSSLGTIELEAKILDLNNETISKTFSLNVDDTIPPEVENVKDITVKQNEKVDFYSHLKITDNSNSDVTKEIRGDYTFTKKGTYKLQYVIKDQSGNETVREFNLIVPNDALNTNNKYFVRVSRVMNVVMVYTKDENGEFTKLVKTFVASAGNGTPIGVFTTAAKYETLSLVGGVWGHYTVQIKGPYWFHSVPYFSKPGSDGNWDDLEYEEYNKLGTLASKGCIRLAVKDSKWIYDNIKKGTTVEIYESDTLPEGVTKPTSIQIDINDEEKRGWDPTDTNPNSPWNK